MSSRIIIVSIRKHFIYSSILLGEKQTSFTFEGVSKDYKLPPMFKGWDIFVAKTPMLDSSHPLFFTSPWTASCNIIMLDHVCVYAFVYFLCLGGLYVIVTIIYEENNIFVFIWGVCFCLGVWDFIFVWFGTWFRQLFGVGVYMRSDVFWLIYIRCRSSSKIVYSKIPFSSCWFLFVETSGGGGPRDRHHQGLQRLGIHHHPRALQTLPALRFVHSFLPSTKCWYDNLICTSVHTI